MSEWKWDVDQAKGGGVDVLYGIYLIQDDLDRGGWVLRLDPIRGETLEELQALAQRIENVLDPPECPQPKFHEFVERHKGQLGPVAECPYCGQLLEGSGS